MNITPKDLLDAGVHFGHQTKRWNPRFKSFLFDHRQGISIIDLTKTHSSLEKAYAYLEDLIANGDDILMVGTKRQAQEIMREAASSTGMPFCVNRWMGGTLTNFETIKRSIAKYKRYQELESSGELAKMHKKEAAAIKREMERMHRNFEGISNLDRLPAAMLVVDVNYEDIAVAEGRRVGMKIVALVDTNSDPSTTDFPVPGNDDAVKSIRIVIDTLVEAIQSGLAQRDSRRISRGQQQLSDARSIAPFSAPVAAAPVVEEVAKVEEVPAVESTPDVPAAEDAAPDAATDAVPDAEDDVVASVDGDDGEEENKPVRPKRPARAGDDSDGTDDADEA